MTGILYPPLRPQSIGEVLDAAFRIFGATLPRCLPFGVMAMVAGQLPNIAALVSGRSLQPFEAHDPLWWMAYLLGSILGISFLNVILLRQEAVLAAAARASAIGSAAGAGTANRVRGVSTTNNMRGMSLAMRRAPAAIVLFALGFLSVSACYLPLIALPPRYLTWGAAVLSIAASYVGVLLCCSWPALLIGGRSVLGSMQYSVQLVRGNWWRSVAVYTVAVCMLAVLYVCAGVIAAVVLPLTGNADLARITAVSAVMGVALGSLFVPFFCSACLVLYGDLEARWQGTDLQRRLASAAVSR